MSSSSSTEPETVSIRTPSRLQRQLSQMADSLGRRESFLVVSHEEPDGDAIGSTLGLARLLEQLGGEVIRFNHDPVPRNFRFLSGADEVVSELPDEPDVEVVVLLDCSSVERLGGRFPPLEHLAPEDVLVIDHHKTIDRETGDRYLDDSEAAATAELIYRLAEEMDVSVDEPLAECLYCGLVTDTGGFRYANTSRTSFRIAGELLEAGVDPWRMTVELFESEPRRRVDLLAEVLQTLRFSSCGRLAFICIDREMVDESERIAELTDGFINYGRSVRGVEVSTQLRERPDGDWKVSFRSKGRVDVSKLAAESGGGGHHNAAACVMAGPPREIRHKLTDRLVEMLGEADSEIQRDDQ